MWRRRKVKSRGLKFSLSCENWITRYRWRSYNTKEPETLDWIDSRVSPWDTFFDIGANVGLYSIYTALRYPHARIVAFEPEYSNLHLLRDNILANGLAEIIWPYSIALSHHSGLSRLYVQDFTPGAALHTESRQKIELTRTKHKVIGHEGIYALTLDSFCQKSGLQPHHIKMDVDGTELEILCGGLKTLRSRSFRSLLIEMPDDEKNAGGCSLFLDGAGLERVWFDPTGKSKNEVWERK